MLQRHAASSLQHLLLQSFLHHADRLLCGTIQSRMVWYGGTEMCLIPFCLVNLVNLANCSDVNCGPLSETSCSGRLLSFVMERLQLHVITGLRPTIHGILMHLAQQWILKGRLCYVHSHNWEVFLYRSKSINFTFHGNA